MALLALLLQDGRDILGERHRIGCDRGNGDPQQNEEVLHGSLLAYLAIWPKF
jgi:hypothetical protein